MITKIQLPMMPSQTRRLERSRMRKTIGAKLPTRREISIRYLTAAQAQILSSHWISLQEDRLQICQGSTLRALTKTTHSTSSRFRKDYRPSGKWVTLLRLRAPLCNIKQPSRFCPKKAASANAQPRRTYLSTTNYTWVALKRFVAIFARICQAANRRKLSRSSFLKTSSRRLRTPSRVTKGWPLLKCRIHLYSRQTLDA